MACYWFCYWKRGVQGHTYPSNHPYISFLNRQLPIRFDFRQLLVSTRRTEIVISLSYACSHIRLALCLLCAAVIHVDYLVQTMSNRPHSMKQNVLLFLMLDIMQYALQCDFTLRPCWCCCCCFCRSYLSATLLGFAPGTLAIVYAGTAGKVRRREKINFTVTNLR